MSMRIHNAVEDNLASIKSWINGAPNPMEFTTNDEFMKLSVELMNRCLYLMRVGVALAPSADAQEKGYAKHRAIIVGHMVRMAKLYEGQAVHIAQRQRELAILFFRMILECAVRTEYLIASPHKRKSCRSFILSSFGPEREELIDLEQKASTRPLIKIEKRMLSSIKFWLRRDRITRSELLNNRLRNMDGLNFREMMKRIGFVEYAYAYSFRNSSHFVHGDWLDIRRHHLKRNGRHYLPNLEFGDPDPRISSPSTKICLGTLATFIGWSKTDPHQVITPVIKDLSEFNDSIDSAHERSL